MTVCVWSYLKHAVPHKEKLVRFGGSLVLSAAIAGLAAYAVKKQYGRDHQPSANIEASATPTAPVIQASYDVDLLGLPITVQPLSSVYVVRVQKDRKGHGLTFYNDKNRIGFWPTNVNRSDSASCGIVRIANHGNVSVFNIIYRFKIHVGAQRDPGGTTDDQIELPIFDLPISSPEKSFYLVDQSGLGGVVELLNGAVAEVQGSTKRERINLQVRIVTFFDRVPMFPPRLSGRS